MRAGLAALAALVFLMAPASAQPGDATKMAGDAAKMAGDAAKMERVAAQAAGWAEQLNAALTAGSEGFDGLNQRMQALLAAGPTRENAAAAAPGLRLLIEQNRENVRRSDAMLAALPAYPADMPTEVPAERMVADARAQNGLLMELLNQYDALIVAVAAGDIAGVNRVRPRLKEGVFSLLGQQRLIFRNRQASVPAGESTHQALGIATQIYRAMIAVARQGLAAREGNGAGAEAAAEILRAEMGVVARDTRALAAAGRSNLKRELAEFEALRERSPKDGAQARLAQAALDATILEAKSFEIGDRLAAFADSNAAVTGAQLRKAGAGSLFTPLTTLEAEFIDVGMKQATMANDAPK